MTEPFIDLFALINIFAIGQALFLIVLVFTKKQKLSQAKVLSALIVFVLAFMLTHHFLLYSRYLLKLPHFLGTGGTFIYLIGPLLYVYARTLTKGTKLKWVDALHLLPFLYFNIRQIPIYIQPFRNRIEFITNFYQKYFDAPPSLSFISSGIPYYAHQVTYLMLAILLLYKHEKKIKARFSNTEKISLAWMKTILYGYIIFTIIHFASFLGAVYFFDIITTAQHVILFNLILSIHIFAIAYRGMQQADFIPLEEVDSPETEETTKYKNSNLKQIQATQYINQLIQIMEDEKLYTNPQLTLQLLAQEMEVNSNYISQVINEQLNQNFYDFVNHYRIEEAKRQLQSPEAKKYTIEAIAQQVGFNSKSTFNRAFKKYTELTPSQYKKTLITDS